MSQTSRDPAERRGRGGRFCTPSSGGLHGGLPASWVHTLRAGEDAPRCPDKNCRQSLNCHEAWDSTCATRPNQAHPDGKGAGGGSQESGGFFLGCWDV